MQLIWSLVYRFGIFIWCYVFNLISLINSFPFNFLNGTFLLFSKWSGLSLLYFQFYCFVLSLCDFCIFSFCCVLMCFVKCIFILIIFAVVSYILLSCFVKLVVVCTLGHHKVRVCKASSSQTMTHTSPPTHPSTQFTHSNSLFLEWECWDAVNINSIPFPPTYSHTSIKMNNHPFTHLQFSTIYKHIHAPEEQVKTILSGSYICFSATLIRIILRGDRQRESGTDSSENGK